MTAPSMIQLASPLIPHPRRARIPVNRAQRWLSSFEEEGTQPTVSVFITQRAFVRLSAHAGSNLDHEVGGWLVGKWCVDVRDGGEFVVIEAALPAPFTRQGVASLTFTQESQVALLKIVEQRFAGKEVLGWYHTHPRMGVFLSSYDLWLHTHFFPEHYQVALVVEPWTAMGGFFVRGEDGSLDTRRYYGFYELQNRTARSVVHWKNLYSPMMQEFGG